MASKKHKYTIVVGIPMGKCLHSFTYAFGHTKDIAIELGKGSACVTARIGAAYDVDAVLSSKNYLISDALCKAYLLHLIVYSEQLSFEQLAVYADDEELASNVGPTMVGLIVDKSLVRPVPVDVLSAGVAKRLIETTKSKWNDLEAALSAYLYSKSKVFEADRLQCLWTAMNGLYNEIAKKAAKHQNANASFNENAKICKLLRIYNLGERFTSPKAWWPLAREVQGVLRDAPNPATRGDFEDSSLADRINRAIEQGDNSPDVTAYGLVLMGMSYYYRCMLFHGNSPLPLYAHSDDGLLAGLRVCNDLLEEFLDENLFLWLDKEHVDNVFERWLTREFGPITADEG